MALKKTQKALKKWTKQKWRTKSGKPSVQGPDATREVYAPAREIAAAPDKYDLATRIKRRAKGQFARHKFNEGKDR
jgi:hypothetical protein